MILIYRADKSIHQIIPGFGMVTTVNGNLYVDGIDTTTIAGDVMWKYIADRVLERDENYQFVHDADYYPEAALPDPTDHDLLMAMAEVLEAELNAV